MQMSDKDFISLLTKTFSENGLSSYLNAEKSDKFLRLTKRMLEENEKYNLTAIKEPEKIILNHYADCVCVAKHIQAGAKIADVGCGAGFPTLPLAIVRDDISIFAIDSTQKRINYVNETAELLGLKNVKAEAMRAEDAANIPSLRESFDIVTARAVAEMRVLSELCIPLVKIQGKFIAMKGKNAEFELTGAKRAISILGGKDARVENITLKTKDEELTHPLIFIEKKSKTPSSYPRAFAQISKKPL